MIVYILCTILFVIGLYALIAKTHLIKKIIGIAVMEYAINLFLILIGYKNGGIAPILLKDMNQTEFIQRSVDPIPQALVVTSIVIGLGVLALMVALALKLYDKFKTFDMSEIKTLRG